MSVELSSDHEKANLRLSNQEKWEQKFALLEQFVAEYGRLPKWNEVYEGVQIGRWCSDQKWAAKKPSYPQQRLDRLLDIGLLKNICERSFGEKKK